jgi:Retroviral aspartyl protease
MRFDGEWLLCEDGIRRPVIRCDVLGHDDQWHVAEFLVDTGADRTVFSEDLLVMLALRQWEPGHEIRGVGGLAATVVITTQIRMTRDDHQKVIFRGEFVGYRDTEVLDMSVLGRDVTQYLAVIVDRPPGRVVMLGPGSAYTIHSQQTT